MKLDEILSTVQDAILANGGTKEMAAKAINEIRKAAEEEKAERKETAAKKSKNDFVFLASDPEGKLGKDNAFTGWVFQIEEGGNPGSILDRVKLAADAFNQTRKGKKAPVRTVGETVQVVPAKFWKTDDGRKTKVKTKEPTYMVTTNNKL